MLNSQKVKELLSQYQPRLGLAQRFETSRRSNFLNFVKKIEGGNGLFYVLKLPKVGTDLMCYLRLAIFHLLGDKGVIFASFPERMRNEKQKIKFLASRGVPALPLAEVEAEGVLVTRHIKGANLKDIFSHNSLAFEDKLKILSHTTRRLKDIHVYFSHGDAQVRNVLVTEGGETIWLDYEYVINPEMSFGRQKARDLMLLISSSTKHLKRAREVVATILNSYPDRGVKRAIFSSYVYWGIVYNLFLNLMNPLLCLRMRKALVEYLLDSKPL